MVWDLDWIQTIDRLQLWRISEATEYRLSPDEIAARWNDRTIREFQDYQRLRGKELNLD